MQARGWTVVVPVRLGPGAKGRLAAPPDLPAAMAGDCLAAVAATPGVRRLIVVAPPGDLPDLPAKAPGAPTPRSATGCVTKVLRQPVGIEGLVPAVIFALAECCGPSAVLLADLPALQPLALASALADGEPLLAAGTASWHVPDADGAGTVLLAGLDPALLPVRFGPNSAAAHLAAGSPALSGQADRLRRDVDTPADLLQAWDLGVGPRTRATIDGVQVTVVSYSTETGLGLVVTDDGRRLPLTAQALSGSGLRHLRPGQRLMCLVSHEQVVAVRINGIGDPLPTQL